MQSVNPFTIGYHLTTGGEQDGFISSLLLVIILSTFGSMGNLAFWLTVLRTTKFSYGVPNLILTVYMVLASAVIIRILTLKNHGALYSTVPALGQRPENKQLSYLHVLQNGLPFAGIALFSVLLIIMDVVWLIANLECLPTFILCGMLLEYVNSILKHVVSIIFVGLEMMFCKKFYNTVFAQTWKVRYGLAILIAVNVYIWFQWMCYNAKEIFEPVRNHTHPSNVTCYDDGVLVNSTCLDETSPMYRVAYAITPYLSPFSTQFYILVLQILCHLFFGVKAVDTIQNRQNSNQTPGRHTSPETPGVVSDLSIAVPQAPTEMSPLLNSARDASLQVSVARLYRPCCSNFNIRFLFAILVNILFITLGLLTYQVATDSIWIPLFTYFRPFHGLLLFLSLLIALQTTANFRWQSAPYTGYEMFLVVSTCCLYCKIGLSFAAAIIRLAEAPACDRASFYSSLVLIVDQVIYGAQIYLQTVFIVHGSRVNAAHHLPRRRLFYDCVLFALVCNGAQWCLECVLYMNDLSSDRIQQYVYGNGAWCDLNHFLLPIAYLYSFFSIFFLLRIFIDRRVHA